MNLTDRVRARNTDPAMADDAYGTNGFSGYSVSRASPVTVSRRH